MAWTATGQVSAYGSAGPCSGPEGTGDLEPGRPAGDYRAISAVFARLRAASASALLTAVLALGRPRARARKAKRRHGGLLTTSTLSPRPTAGPWHKKEDAENRFIELLTSHDGGRRWHEVTPSVCWPARTPGGPTNPTEPARTADAVHTERPDAWLPVGRSYHGQSAELDVFMASDAGRRWVPRGRFPGGIWGAFSS